MKNKKAIAPILVVFIILVSAGIIGGGYYYGTKNGYIKQEQYTQGYIPYQTLELTGTNSDSFTCDADECIVAARMKIEKVSGVITPAWKCLAGNCAGERILYSTEQECDDSKKWCSTWTSSQSASCPFSSCAETTMGSQTYTAYWNFCPTFDANYNFCTGTSASATGYGDKYSGQTLFDIGYKKLLRNQQITFKPKYPDQTLVTDKSLYITKYDGSCRKAYDNGDTRICLSGQILCEPLANKCESGYYFQNKSIVCPYYNDLYEGYKVFSNVCTSIPSPTMNYNGYPLFPRCFSPNEPEYNTFRICDGSINLNNVPCLGWGNSGTCDEGKECIVTDTQTVGFGLGSCNCRNYICTKGQRKAVIGANNKYEECTASGDCYGWNSGIITCKETLIFDSTATNEYGQLGVCVCPTGGNECTNPGTPPSCTSNSVYSKCTSYINGDKTCFHQVSTSCKDVEKCVNGICTCDLSNSKSCSGQNAVKCDGTTKYFGCTLISGCYLWDTISKPVPENQICDSSSSVNQLTLKQGCKWAPQTLSSFERCDTSTNVDGINVCKTNSDDTNYCNSLTSPAAICDGDTKVKQCAQIPNSNINGHSYCYNKTIVSCTGTTSCSNGVCASQGCAYPTGPNYATLKCSESKDANNLLFETCVNNVCVPVNDTYKVLSTESSKTSKCIGNAVYNKQSYTGKSGSISRWIKLKDCSGQTPICME